MMAPSMPLGTLVLAMLALLLGVFQPAAAPARREAMLLGQAWAVGIAAIFAGIGPAGLLPMPLGLGAATLVLNGLALPAWRRRRASTPAPDRRSVLARLWPVAAGVALVALAAALLPAEALPQPAARLVWIVALALLLLGLLALGLPNSGSQPAHAALLGMQHGLVLAALATPLAPGAGLAVLVALACPALALSRQSRIFA